MSTDYSLSLFVGVAAPYRSFWVKKSNGLACPENHRTDLTQPFCSQCGQRIEEQKIRVPTEAFAAYAASLNLTPKKAWKRLTDEDEHNHEGVAIYEGAAVTGSDTDGRKVPILGKRIRDFDLDDENEDEDLSVPMSDVEVAVEEVKAEAKKLGIPGEVRLYPAGFIGY